MNEHIKPLSVSQQADELEEHMMHELERVVTKSTLHYLADGKVQPGSFTVLHNGVLIQDHIPIEGEPTTAAPLKAVAEKGPLYLQDHGNPVRFRNIWLRKL